jgi:DNA-directed RNA polymerase specialized sigma24 family protein
VSRFPTHTPGELFRAHWPACQRWAWAMDRRHGGDHEPAAADALAYAAAHYAGRAPFAALLRTALRFTRLNEPLLRQRRAAIQRGDLVGSLPDSCVPLWYDRRADDDDDAPTPTAGPDLSRLTPAQREAVDAIYYRGLPQPEAARQLGIRPATLRQRHAQALKRLRERWEARP